MLKENSIQDLDINQIMKYHNCRYPCLMLDYITEVVPGKTAKGYKYFTYNEWFFPGHFVDDPNVPSSIQIEAMSQTLLMTFLTLPGYAQVHTACLKMEHVEFKKKIIPGQRLDLTAVLKMFRGGVAAGTVEGFVDNELACRADFVIGIPDEIKKYTPHGKSKEKE